jgi:hypothetical protein
MAHPGFQSLVTDCFLPVKDRPHAIGIICLLELDCDACKRRVSRAISPGAEHGNTNICFGGSDDVLPGAEQIESRSRPQITSR